MGRGQASQPGAELWPVHRDEAEGGNGAGDQADDAQGEHPTGTGEHGHPHAGERGAGPGRTELPAPDQELPNSADHGCASTARPASETTCPRCAGSATRKTAPSPGKPCRNIRAGCARQTTAPASAAPATGNRPSPTRSLSGDDDLRFTLDRRPDHHTGTIYRIRSASPHRGRVNMVRRGHRVVVPD